MILRQLLIIQIHASTINHDKEGRIRLGTDLRFVNSSRPWDQVPISSHPILEQC